MQNSILNKIRPFHLSNGLKLAHKKDIDWFNKRKFSFLDVPCPACGSSKYIDIIEKDGGSFYRCDTCSMLYLSPRPTQEQYHEFYQVSATAEYFNKKIFPEVRSERKCNIYYPRLEWINTVLQKEIPSFITSKEHYLEIGAGYGDFASIVKEKLLFASVTVVEPNPLSAASCQKKNLNTINSMFEEIVFLQEKYGFIASFECIEHVSNPDNYMNIIKEILHPGGVLCLSCPNGLGLDVVELRNISTTIDWEHPNLFSPEAMRIFLKKHGFTIIAMCTPGILDVELLREAVYEGNIIFPPLSLYSQILFSNNPGLDAKFQNFLVENLLSSHMLIMARKVG